MLRHVVLIGALVVGGAAVAGAGEVDSAAAFARNFTDETLRVDLVHVGNATEELFTLDRAFRQGPWAGSTKVLVDPFPYGRYRARALDAATGEVLFEQGFDSYFGEYRTTDVAARGARRAFAESVLLPCPRRPFRLLVEARERGGATTEVGSFEIDPADPAISRERPAPGAVVVEQRSCGDPHACLDLAVLGEGYTAAEEAAFRADLERFTATLLGFEPYATLAPRISVRGVLVPSAESGCDEPGKGRWRRTALGASFDSLGSERYLLTEDNRAVRDAAAAVPYDALVLMVNHTRYGGGGIYGLFAVFTAHNQWSDYLLVHELGHSFAGLADEYYTSATAYNELYPRGVEPPEPNITALLDPAALKWRHLVARDTPLPTPWAKLEFEQLDMAYQKEREELNRRIASTARAGAPAAEVEALEARAEERSRQNAEQVSALLAASPAAATVGAFEGAGYTSTGLFRPALDCIMFTKNVRPFCPVCREAIAAMVRRYAE